MKKKKVLAYLRISTKEQSNFSLDFQKETIQRACDDQGLEVMEWFTDNGQSAKSFNRVAWNRLEKYLQAHKSQIFAIMVAKYDRLIRNAAEGLAFLERAESQLNVRVLSAMERIALDPYDPMFYKMRADMLVQAEFELKYIRYRSNQGIYQARRSGRYINKAPWPYENARDTDNRPIIVLNDKKGAAIVEQIAKDFNQGLSLQAISERAKKAGFPNTGKSAVTRILNNPCHAGLIIVPAFRSEPERLIKGIHEPCYHESLFWANQQLMNGAQIKPKFIQSTKLPLRGLLKCEHCGHTLTGSASRGRNKRYWYYRCLNCKNSNYNADKVDTRLKKVLSYMNLPGHYLEAIERMIKERVDDHLKSSHRTRTYLQNEIKTTQSRLDKLEEKYILEDLSREVYQKWSASYNKELSELQMKLEEAKDMKSIIWDRYERKSHLLADIPKIYEAATVTQKQSLIKFLFHGDISVSRGKFHTQSNPKLIFCNTNKIKFLEVKNEGKNGGNFDNFPESTRSGNKNEPLLNDVFGALELISQMSV